MSKKRIKGEPPSRGRVPLGHPNDGEDRIPMRTVSFRAPKDVDEALEKLMAHLGGSVRTRQSVAIRQAILDAEIAQRSPARSSKN